MKIGISNNNLVKVFVLKYINVHEWKNWPIFYFMTKASEIHTVMNFQQVFFFMLLMSKHFFQENWEQTLFCRYF